MSALAEPRAAAADLSPTSQLVLRASVGFDLALRTGLASLIAIPGTLSATRRDTRAQLDQLDIYRSLAAGADVRATFPAPRELPAIRATAPPRGTFRPRDGRVRMLHFESPYEAINPDVRAAYAAHRENGTAWAQHWCHDDGPRPTLAVIHGFGASPYWLNSAFFALPWLYGKGYDVLMYLLPFHGVRQARAAFSGWGLFAHGPASFNEAIIHAVHDFRVFAAHLREQGVAQLAVTGLSLGGYMTALLAAVCPDLAAVVPNAAVADVGKLADEWWPANALLALGLRLGDVDRDAFHAALKVHSPLTYPPAVPHERRMIIGGLGDRLAPPAQSLALWRHWAEPRLHWFPGNHVLHAGRGAYLKEMLGFLRGVGFRP